MQIVSNLNDIKQTPVSNNVQVQRSQEHFEKSESYAWYNNNLKHWFLSISGSIKTISKHLRVTRYPKNKIHMKKRYLKWIKDQKTFKPNSEVIIKVKQVHKKLQLIKSLLKTRIFLVIIRWWLTKFEFLFWAIFNIQKLQRKEIDLKLLIF